LGGNLILRIEKSNLGEQSICLFVLAEEAGLACLLHKFGDMTLVGESECQDVVTICRIELGGFGKFGLGSAEVFAIEKPRSGEVSGFGGFGLSFVEGAGIWLDSFARRRGGLLG